MRIEQQFNVNAPRDAVWQLIRDPERMLSCVPGCKSIEKLTDTLYKAHIEVRVGPIHAGFLVDVEITAESAPESFQSVTRGEEGSRASELKSDNTVQLNAISVDETEVIYSSDVMITGRLGRFGAGMIKKIADRHALQFAQAFKHQVEAGVIV